MSMSNPFTNTPPTSAAAVTPSDTATFPPSMIYVGSTGDVAVLPADQAGAASPLAVTFATPAAGSTLPVLAIRVMATNTTTGAARTGITRCG